MARPLTQVTGRLERDPHIPYLSERDAAEYCGYFDRGCADPVRSFQRWARRWGVPVKRVGRARRYDPRVLEAFMDREPWTVRHREPVQRVARTFSVIRHAEQSARTPERDGSPEKLTVQ